MILRSATIKYAGYDPDELKPKSQKRICVSCDKCGRIRWIKFNQYRDLCHKCKMKSQETKQKMKKSGKIKIFTNEHKNNLSIATSEKKNGFWGKHLSKESIQLGIKNRDDVSGENNPNWKGGYVQNRNHLLHEKYCTKLNKRFKGSEGHHITRSIIIYIPSELHKHIMPHSLISGIGMAEINALALQYLYGCDY